jgi:type IV pilus assembly protein PilM
LIVGGSCTTVAIMGENCRPFIRDMTFAGNDIIKHIAADRNMSTEDVRNTLSGQSPAAAKAELNESLEKACQPLIVDVSNTLRYYATQEQSTRVDKIFVCGGFALTNGFVELLNRRLGVEVVLWNPLEKISTSTEPQFRDICGRKGPALAVAAGLAMRTV